MYLMMLYRGISGMVAAAAAAAGVRVCSARKTTSRTRAPPHAAARVTSIGAYAPFAYAARLYAAWQHGALAWRLSA